MNYLPNYSSSTTGIFPSNHILGKHEEDAVKATGEDAVKAIVKNILSTENS